MGTAKKSGNVSVPRWQQVEEIGLDRVDVLSLSSTK